MATSKKNLPKMKGVVDDIIVKAVGDDRWQLMEPFDWYGITVPAGFITDFASIPRPFRNWINPVGRIKPAALVHDYLYHLKGHYIDATDTEFNYSRKAVDDIFLAIMKRVGVSWTKRRAAYTAVRLFGWHWWNRTDDQGTGRRDATGRR